MIECNAGEITRIHSIRLLEFVWQICVMDGGAISFSDLQIVCFDS